MKHSWRWLNEHLSAMTEDQVLRLLDEERHTHKRVTFLERLHQRYTSLRASRERVEILKEAVK